MNIIGDPDNPRRSEGFKHTTIKCNAEISIGGIIDPKESLRIKKIEVPEAYKTPYFTNILREENINSQECSIHREVCIIMNGRIITENICMREMKYLGGPYMESVDLGLKYSELGLNTLIGISFYDMNEVREQSLIGSTCVELWENLDVGGERVLRQGLHTLIIHKGKQLTLDTYRDILGIDPVLDVTHKLIELNKSLVGLDLSHPMHSKVQEEKERICGGSRFSYIDICFQTFDGFPVIYYEEPYQLKSMFLSPTDFDQQKFSPLFASAMKVYDPAVLYTNIYDSFILSKSKTKEKKFFLDIPNAITEKNKAMIKKDDRSAGEGLKPNAEEQAEIDNLLLLPDFRFITLEEEDRTKAEDLFWRFRYELSQNKEALPIFLLSVKWTDKGEVAEAYKLLNMWEPIHIEQALSLLSALFCANPHHNFRKISNNDIIFSPIRQYAVERVLVQLSNSELSFILLQLTQAFRYEVLKESKLKDFLISRAVQDLEIAVYLYWQLNLEKENPKDKIIARHYENFFDELIKSMRRESHLFFDHIEEQRLFHKSIKGLAQRVKAAPKDEAKQTLIKIIQGVGEPKDLMELKDPVRLFTNPDVEINGVYDSKFIIFKSATKPIKLTLRVHPDSYKANKGEEEYHMIYKDGDDMRQDQLILQVISLMDHLLQVVIDLKFTIYNVVSTTIDDGFMEFVSNSNTIRAILEEYKDNIGDYFREYARVEIDGEFVVDEDKYKAIMDNYIKSTAGYCAVTYILGIGDRHLENLLINKDGRMFHIDFGFILGCNPPAKNFFTTAVRLSSAMTNCMNPENYQRFLNMCGEAFIHLRYHRKYILNLFYLMIHSGIEGLESKGGQDTFRITNLYNKFMPKESDEDAKSTFLKQVQEASGGKVMKIHEYIHNWKN